MHRGTKQRMLHVDHTDMYVDLMFVVNVNLHLHVCAALAASLQFTHHHTFDRLFLCTV